MFSISSSNPAAVRDLVPLNAMCSRKCAVPFVCASSYLEPASIHTPTVAVSAPGTVSVATRSPFASVVTYTPRSRTHRTSVTPHHFPIAHVSSHARPPPSRPPRARLETPLRARPPISPPIASLSSTHLRLDTARDPTMRERHRLRTSESREDVPRARGAVVPDVVPGPHGRRVSRRVLRRARLRARVRRSVAHDRRRRRRRARTRRPSSRQRAKHRGRSARGKLPIDRHDRSKRSIGPSDRARRHHFFHIRCYLGVLYERWTSSGHSYTSDTLW